MNLNPISPVYICNSKLNKNKTGLKKNNSNSHVNFEGSSILKSLDKLAAIPEVQINSYDINKHMQLIKSAIPEVQINSYDINKHMQLIKSAIPKSTNWGNVAPDNITEKLTYKNDAVSDDSENNNQSPKKKELALLTREELELSYDEINFQNHGARLDFSLKDLKFDIDGEEVAILTDNDIVSESYAREYGLSAWGYKKILSDEQLQILENNLRLAKEKGLELPERIYLTDMFHPDKKTGEKVLGYFSEVNQYIFLNIDNTIPYEQLFKGTLFHELGHLADYKRGKANECHGRLSSNLIPQNPTIKSYSPDELKKEIIEQYGNIRLDNGEILTVNEIVDCISDYAATDNAEFVAEICSHLMAGNIVQDSTGRYWFANDLDHLNSTQAESLQKVMRCYNMLAKGRILEPSYI